MMMMTAFMGRIAPALDGAQETVFLNLTTAAPKAKNGLTEHAGKHAKKAGQKNTGAAAAI